MSPFEHDECDTVLSQSPNRQKMATGEKHYKCPDCHKTFDDEAKLKRHVYVHSREKSLQCLVCDRKFLQSGRLKAHMLTHSGNCMTFLLSAVHLAFFNALVVKFIIMV